MRYHFYMKNKLITFEKHLNESLKDPGFKKEWENSKIEYQVACSLIEKRLKKKLSQRDLAKKLHTSQAVISRIESMNGNPSLSFLKRIALALDLKLHISLT